MGTPRRDASADGGDGTTSVPSHISVDRPRSARYPPTWACRGREVQRATEAVVETDDLTRLKLLQPSYERLLADASDAEFLPRVSSLLEAVGGESDFQTIWDRVADAVLRRFADSKPQLRSWLDERALRDAPGEIWLRARLSPGLGQRAQARDAWDRVVERGIGRRPARYLARSALRLEDGDPAGAFADLREAFRDPASYEEMERGARLLRRMPRSDLPTPRRLPIGVLRNPTTPPTPPPPPPP